MGGFPQSPLTGVPGKVLYGSHSDPLVFNMGARRPSQPPEGGDLKQTQHAVAKCLEVEHVVNAVRFSDVGEVGHAEDGVDEHDKEEKKSNVEKGRK